MSANAPIEAFRSWMRDQSWEPLEHQETTWRLHTEGKSGLICVPTGMGKTYGAYLGPLAQAVADDPPAELRILWITPLRAMARDIEAALRRPIDELGLDITIASRTGDTSSSRKRKLRTQLPHVLLTTPESLSLMLSYEDSARHFGSVTAVIIDEWHELCASKRGTQTELAVARLRDLNPELQTWALSATVGNLEVLAQAAVGEHRSFEIVTSDDTNPASVECAVPPLGRALPWFGFIGTTMFDVVVDALDVERTTLVFTNTRNQAERWHQAILERRPAWADRIAVHHGSLDVADREEIEQRLDEGELSVVVCTSSLDLGVDYAPVDQTVQVGSPMSVARLLQRAGRAGHQPGATSKVTLVPTHAMQLIEVAALRLAIERRTIEPRSPCEEPLDVLVQHLLTLAAGPGFEPDALFDEVRTSYAYRNLSRDTFDWALQFVEHGGASLQNYPAYHKVELQADGRYRMSQKLARMHRVAIGTITSNAQVRVKFLNGKNLGHVDEQYVARLSPGDRFVFGGRTLQLVNVRNMEVRVRVADGAADHAPRWLGGRLAWSSVLAEATLDVLNLARDLLEREASLLELGDEVHHLDRVLRLQHHVSALPGRDAVHAELAESAEGTHLFLFPFAGRAAHEGLAALLAHRLGRRHEATFALSVNDMGLELLCAGGFDFRRELDEALFDVEGLETDTFDAVNAAELGRRQFREVARVAGLVFEGWPSSRKSSRQLQTSAGLLHDVFARWEPDNLLLAQARREVLERQFDAARLRDALRKMAAGVDLHLTNRFSPLAFPLVVDRAKARVSSESQHRRLERMKQAWADACA